ncbi:helix-turn-helix domain-containing protein [Pseudoalteromonas sp. TAB23]|uniref:helix-turn-helix domain-containing protein n=1 Tax=Pseudoalteromonas sp. TAB23 TaxID=1938595 RepID=UPI000467A064|nr:helix-turn-helix domain-containing protein [Pseudoalteromonas sp. TAB23]
MNNGNIVDANIPEDTEKRREWIKYQLKIRGISIAKLAREHDVSRQALSTALVRSNPRWEYVISNALGKAPNDIWPERYQHADRNRNIIIPITQKNLSKGA